MADLRELQKTLERLDGGTVAAAVATEVAPALEQRLHAALAPGKGNGWAPSLTVRPAGGGLAVDSGDPARLPIGLPEVESRDVIEAAARKAIARLLGVP